MGPRDPSRSEASGSEQLDMDKGKHAYCPDPWADPKSRSTLGFCTLHYRSIRALHWGIYCLDPPGGLGGASHQGRQLTTISGLGFRDCVCRFPKRWALRNEGFENMHPPSSTGPCFALVHLASIFMRGASSNRG